MRFRRMMVTVSALGMVATLIPAGASAQAPNPNIGGFRLRVEELTPGGTGPGVVIQDEVNEDLPGETGAINLFAVFGNVIVDNTQGYSKGSVQVSSTAPAEMKLTSYNVTGTAGTIVRLTLEDTDFAGQSSPSLEVTNSLVNVILSQGATITTQAWIAAAPPDLGGLQGVPAGTLDAMSTILDSHALTVTSSAGDSVSKAYFEATGLPYALYTQILISFGESGTVSFDQTTTVALSNQALIPPDTTGSPEPASLLLIGTGVVALAGKMRRRKLTRV